MTNLIDRAAVLSAVQSAFPKTLDYTQKTLLDAALNAVRSVPEAAALPFADDAVGALDVAAKALWRAAEIEAARKWDEHEATDLAFSDLRQSTRDSLTRTVALAILRALEGGEG
ncbi:MAG: hypothetical protein C0427_17050 [Rhodobacter sp.]|nr:hypothetical protein [Rhodobacter sp.]